jgi:hypothetical protein
VLFFFNLLYKVDLVDMDLPEMRKNEMLLLKKELQKKSSEPLMTPSVPIFKGEEPASYVVKESQEKNILQKEFENVKDAKVTYDH